MTSRRIDAEYRLRAAGGGWKSVRALGMAVERDAAGRPTRLAGTLRDLTARHEAQDELRAAFLALWTVEPDRHAVLGLRREHSTDTVSAVAGPHRGALNYGAS